MRTASKPSGRVPIAPGIVVSRLEAAALRGIVEGLSLQQIADQQDTSRTVASIAASRAYKKIGCKDRFSVRIRLQELHALEKVCPPARPTAEALAVQLIVELRRTGRYHGSRGVLIQPLDYPIGILCTEWDGSEDKP